LTRRANHGHDAIISKSFESLRSEICGGLFLCLPVSPFEWRPRQDLTRRANHRHIGTIERNADARANDRCGLFLCPDFTDRTAARHVRTPHPRICVVETRVVVRASSSVRNWPARANVPAGGAPLRPPAAPCSQGIRFAPEMIAPGAIMPRNLFSLKEHQVTAYLISLALLGLVAIAVWEGIA